MAKQTIKHKGKRYGVLGPHALLGRDGVVRDHNGEPLRGKFVGQDRAATWAAEAAAKAPPPPKPKQRARKTKKGGN